MQQITHDPVRIFVGADRSQLLALSVLDHSIRARTSRAVEISSLEGVDLPEPPDPRHRARTGFSFARFAIPDLAGRTGRAIYLDADMLVLADIGELADMPLNAAKVLCQEELPDAMAKTAPKKGARRRNQCSVMVLDCARLDWNAAEIIAGLGPRYGYDELLSELCILDEADISRDLPIRWNSLEHLASDTALIHYTDMMTQPWVAADNRNGWKWVDEVRAMLTAGAIRMAQVEEEITLGYARPSLLVELELVGGAPLASDDITRLKAIDRDAGFRPHATLSDTLAARSFFRRVAGRLRRMVSGA